MNERAPIPASSLKARAPKDERERLGQRDGPVTAVIRQAPRPGMESELESWMEGIGTAASRFPGFLGRKVIPPVGPVSRDYVVILWFETLTNLESWVISGERASWIERGEPLVDGGFHFQNVGGLASLFLSAEERFAAGPKAPARWKMAVILVVLLYPLVLGLRYLYDALFIGAPVPVKVLLGVLTSVAIVTFVALPWSVKLLQGWLYRGR